MQLQFTFMNFVTGKTPPYQVLKHDCSDAGAKLRICNESWKKYRELLNILENTTALFPWYLNSYLLNGRNLILKEVTTTW